MQRNLFDRLLATEGPDSLGEESLVFAAAHIKKYFQRVYFNRIPRESAWYKSHGPAHTEDILARLVRLMEILEQDKWFPVLSASELFVLIVSSYLQHVGLFGGFPAQRLASMAPERYGKEAYAEEKMLTAQAVDSLKDMFFIDDGRLRDAVELICTTESYDRLLAQGPAYIDSYLASPRYDDIALEDGSQLRVRLLYALWSLAHLVATSQERLPDPVRTELLAGNRTESYELNFWLRSYCVQRVRVFARPGSTIGFQFDVLLPRDTDYKREVADKVLAVLEDGAKALFDLLRRKYAVPTTVTFLSPEVSEDPKLDRLLRICRHRGIDIGLPSPQRPSADEAEAIARAQSLVEDVVEGGTLEPEDITILRITLWSVPDQENKIVRDGLIKLIRDDIPPLIERGDLPRSVLTDANRGGVVELARLIAEESNYSSRDPVAIALRYADESNADKVVQLLVVTLSNAHGKIVAHALSEARRLVTRIGLEEDSHQELFHAVKALRRNEDSDRELEAGLIGLSDSLLAELYPNLPAESQREVEEQVLSDLRSEGSAPFRRELVDTAAVLLYDAGDSPNQERMFQRLIDVLFDAEESDVVKESLVNNLIFLLPRLRNGQKKEVRKAFRQLTDQGVAFGRVVMSRVLQRAELGT